jgi:hypothetical protein
VGIPVATTDQSAEEPNCKAEVRIELSNLGHAEGTIKVPARYTDRVIEIAITAVTGGLIVVGPSVSANYLASAKMNTGLIALVVTIQIFSLIAVSMRRRRGV